MDITLVLLHNNLRLHDNPALYEACQTDSIVIPLYILDQTRAVGTNSLSWLGASLRLLEKDLASYNMKLIFRHGNISSIITEFLKSHAISAVYCNKSHILDEELNNAKIGEICKSNKVKFKQFDGELLFDPAQLRTGSKSPFKVFTPFMRAALKLQPPCQPIGFPKKPLTINHLNIDSDPLPASSNLIANNWKVGEAAAYKKFENFVESYLDSYADNRNFPAQNGNSALSPHMHFGEISPRFMWHKITDYFAQTASNGAQTFRTELIWREFSGHLLHHFPYIINQPFRREFNNFEWETDPIGLQAWKDGMTGFPLVDAGMRELKQTGFIHNRVRMVVASFLTKDLLLDWKIGEEWFWENLVDADLAANAMNWQWVAGCGVDAAPYYRIFNPYTQSLRFDPNAEYIKKYIPELRNIPPKSIHNILQNPVLGYPIPIVDHDERRKLALEKYKTL